MIESAADFPHLIMFGVQYWASMPERSGFRVARALGTSEADALDSLAAHMGTTAAALAADVTRVWALDDEDHRSLNGQGTSRVSRP